MSTPVKVAGFLAALAALFGVSLGVGDAVGPVSEPAAQGETHGADHEASGQEQPEAAEQEEIPGGLMIAQNGYAMALADPTPTPGRSVPVDFTITGLDGRPVTSYDVEHEKRLHLIAVRRDFTGFQHVHPVLDEAGTWSTDLDLTPGGWRLYADFKAGGADALTLGADLAVAGDYQPAPAAAVTRTAEVDGYSVTLEGDLTAGTDSELTLTVTKDGRPVTDLDPYLGAYGHLVALREGDLAYLHVHPDGTPGDGVTEPGPDVVFYAAVPSSGGYRLFLDFKHGGVVRTAAFTVGTVGTDRAVDPATGEEQDDAHDH